VFSGRCLKIHYNRVYPLRTSSQLQQELVLTLPNQLTLAGFRPALNSNCVNLYDIRPCLNQHFSSSVKILQPSESDHLIETWRDGLIPIHQMVNHLSHFAIFFSTSVKMEPQNLLL